MKPESFTNRAPGRLVRIGDAEGATHAFVPDPLPPNWQWPEGMWPRLLEAHQALARLDGTARHLPDPGLILTPLQKREAQRSSSLEGTFTDPVQQALFQLDPRLPESATDPVNAFREVFNYSEALALRAKTRERLPLSLRLIRDLHRTLMTGVRGSDKSPGEFRKYQNQIGKPPRFIPPPAAELPGLLDNLEHSLHSDLPPDRLVAAFVVHYQFEALHPFMDGNGRVGRLLLAVCIAEWCGLSDQWLYMSAYFDKHKDEYMERLLAVSTHGDWGGWLEFCLLGVLLQAQDTQRRCDQLVSLNRRFHSSVAKTKGSARLGAIVDHLFQSPAVTVTGISDLYGVTYPTARADLNKLAGIGVLVRVPDARLITYFSPEIFRAIYADEDDG